MSQDHSPTELQLLNQTATDYFLRRRETDWSEADEAQLKQWLKADAKHVVIYANVARTWTSLAKMPRPSLASDVSPIRAASEYMNGPMEGSHSHFLHARKSFFAGWLAPVMLGLVLVGTGAGWYGWHNTPGYSRAMANTTQQPHTLDLPDGSHIVLNIDSAVDVRYYPGKREVTMTRGEAFFEVTPDTKRPFTVDTGPSRITVVGTAFNVRAAPPALQIKVQNGKVQVQPDREKPGKPVLLEKGQGISITADGKQYASISSAIDTVGNWRQGQLIFRQAQLQEVVEELQRYTRQTIHLDKDQRLIALPVTGSAITSHPEIFLQALPQLLPVRVQQQNGGWVISRR